MKDEEETLSCGRELATSAEVPDAIAALMFHVAINLEAHAKWVGRETEEARGEHEAMLKVAEEYRRIGTASAGAAAAMRRFADLPVAVHDPRTLDRKALSEWMRTKLQLQRDLATLLLKHAETSENALQHLDE